LALGDVNKDGYPDIYVSNDYVSNDLLYINQRDGTFKNEIATYMSYQTKSSKGNDMADINNDGEKDYILYDQKQLFVYEKTGEAIFKYGFDISMESELKFTKGPDSRAIISLNSKSGELFLFDKGGFIDTDIAFHSEKPASFYTKDNSLNVFTVFDNKVYYYMIGD
jgi:hypothetical protein